MKKPSLILLLSAVVYPHSLPAAPEDYQAVRHYGSEITGKRYIAGPDGEQVSYHAWLDGPFFDAETSEIQLENIALASETVDAATGQKRLAFTATLRNNGPGYYEDAGLEFETSMEGWQVRIPSDTHANPDLPPMGTASRAQGYEILVAPTMAEAAKAAILAGQHIRPRGVELHQFTVPAVAVDSATDHAFVNATGMLIPPNGVTLEFEQMTPLLAGLQQGQLLVEAAGPEGYHLVRQHPTMLEPRLSQSVHAQEIYGEIDFGKLRETEVVEVTAVTTRAADGHVLVEGRKRKMQEVLRHATFLQRTVDAYDEVAGLNPTDPYFQPTGVNARSNYTRPPPTPLGPRDPVRGFFDAMPSFHFPINEVAITRGISLDGEVLFDALNIEMKIKFRHALPVAAAMRLGMKLETTLRISAESGADNENAPILEKEKQILDVTLATIVFNVAGVPVSIRPQLTAKVGVGLKAPSRLVIPVQSSLECGAAMDWDSSRPQGQRVRFKPYHRIRPLDMSDPSLGDSLALTANAFAEAGLTVSVNEVAGPAIAARTNAQFTLNPLANPWWSLDGDMDMTGAFKLRVLNFDIAEVSATLIDGPTLFHEDAGSGVTGGSGAPGGTAPGPMDPVEGGHVRWGRLATWENYGPTFGLVERVAGTAEDVFAAFPSGTIRQPLLRVGPKGDILWAKSSPGLAIEKIAATPDGGFVMVSNFLARYLSRHDGQGNVLWTRGFSLTEEDNTSKAFYLSDIVVTGTAPAATRIHLIGYGSNYEQTLDTDVVMITFDGSGTLLHSNRYASSNMAENVHEAIVRMDGSILICGNAKGPEPATPIIPIVAGSEVGGLLMSVQTDGTFGSASRQLGAIDYKCVTEGPDGTLFAGGWFAHSGTLDVPGFLLVRYPPGTAPPGSEGLVAVAIGENIQKIPARGHPPVTLDYLPDSGNTPYDNLGRLAWTPVGLVAAGTTGLGVNTAVTVMCFTEKLSLRWWTTLENTTQEDAFFDMAVTEDGIFTVGRTKSFASSAGGLFYAAMINKLPFEGKLDLHPAESGFSRYLTPGIMRMPGLGELDPLIVAPDEGLRPSAPMVHTTVAQPVTITNETLPALTDMTLETWRAIQAGDAGAPMSFTQWSEYHRTAGDPDANSDGDARTNYEEYLFGGDPHSSQSGRPGLEIETRPGGGLRLQRVRSRAARNVPLTLQRAANPESAGNWQPHIGSWLPAPGKPGDESGTERGFLDIEFPAAQKAEFYRLRSP